MPVITVGENSSVDTIQKAINAMALLGPSPSERGTIVVPPGHYSERVSDYVSHADVIAQIPGTAAIEYAGTDTGGTYRIGVEDEGDGIIATVDKVIAGLRIIRNSSGSVVGSEPPEAALYVGNPEHVDGRWDNIIIRDCITEGVHDSIQIAGFFTAPDPEDPDPLGLVIVENCIIRCVHDALTVKGDCRLISKGNLIHVDTRGIEPYLTQITEWKSTGFHMNRGAGGLNPHSYFLSCHDTMYLIGGPNIGDEGVAGQAQMVGYLFYDLKVGSGTAPTVNIHRSEIIEPHIHLEWNDDETPLNPIAGISIWSKRIAVPPDYFKVVGGSITVRQMSTHQNAPGVVYGVLVDNEGSNNNSDSIVRVLGTNIRVENLKSGGNAYSLATIGEHDKIEADVYSDEPIFEGEPDTITLANHKP